VEVRGYQPMMRQFFILAELHHAGEVATVSEQEYVPFSMSHRADGSFFDIFIENCDDTRLLEGKTCSLPHFRSIR
jgi:hypothetical protein